MCASKRHRNVPLQVSTRDRAYWPHAWLRASLRKLVRANGVCRMHGCGRGSGGPLGGGNGNYRHGRYTKESTALRELTREVNELLAKTLAAAR